MLRDMTLLDATQFDFARQRRRRILIALAVVLVLVLAALGWMYRHWPQEHLVSQFFVALEKKDFEGAYGIYFHDPAWRQHAQKYAQYTYSDFYRDWGPSGEWGYIKSHRIYGSVGSDAGTGVIVEVIINERADHTRLFVQKSDKTLSVYPY
jgi:hypothetical protein